MEKIRNGTLPGYTPSVDYPERVLLRLFGIHFVHKTHSRYARRAVVVALVVDVDVDIASVKK
jgi:hypothetical protein